MSNDKVRDAETARGARIWNHANELALSLRAIALPIAKEIIDAWLNTPIDQGEAHSEWNRQQIERVREIEERQGRYPNNASNPRPTSSRQAG